jgi:capsular polysaccharide biosynthesis protein
LTSMPRIICQRVWRHKWLVVGVCLLALQAAALVSLSAETKYTSKAALMVVSQNRAPEQDSILTVGYVSYFNDLQYQGKLREQAGVPGDVTFAAESVAASPLLYVTATSTNSTGVASAARLMAEAFQREINDRMQAQRDAAIASVRQPFEDIRAAGGVVPEQALIQMQDRISMINADNTNELQSLRLDSTVETSAPATARLLGVSLAGGLIAGILLAFVLGTYSRRLENENDVALKAGISTLATIPSIRSPRRADERMLSVQRLTNLIALKVPRPAVVAVASARRSDATAELARALASQRASQDVRTLVVDATLPGTARVDAGDSDLAHVIADRDLVALGDVLAGDGKLDPERVRAALEGLKGLVDLVVVVAPPLLDDGAGQAICAAADQTVIVVEQGVSRSDDVVETARLMEDVTGTVLGAVVMARPGRLSRSERRARAAVPPEREVEREPSDVGDAGPSVLQLGKQSSLR